MRRDIDLIRKILLEVEKKESISGWTNIELDDYSEEQITYHVKLLAEAGYLEAKNLTTKDKIDYKPQNLT